MNEMKFKLRLVKQERPKPVGLYEQMKGGTHVPTSGNFSLMDIRKAIGDLYIKDPSRGVKITTNQAGYDLFTEALKEQANKTLNNEYRKRFSLKSKIFKQIN